MLVILVVGTLGACSRVGSSDGEAVGTPAAMSSDLHDGSYGLSSPAPDPDFPVQICGIEGTIETAFIVPAGLQHEDFVPALAGAPELEGKGGSLFLFYEGTATIEYLTGIPGATWDPAKENVVCVITPDGQPNIYSEVSSEGLVVPPGPVIVRPITDESICSALPDASVCKRP